MLQRIIGSVILLAGIALTLLGVSEWSSTGATANLLSVESSLNGEVFNSSAWSTSSYLLSASLICVGVAVITAGTWIARSKQAGYLFLAAAALFIAVFPSAFSQARFVRQYIFVSPNTQGSAAYTTIIFLIVAFSSFVSFVIVRRNRFWHTARSSIPPTDNASGPRLHSSNRLYRAHLQDLSKFLFWIGTSGLVMFCVTFGTPILARISATKVVVWAGCKPHGFEALGSCPAGSFAERFLPLTHWISAIFAPITLIESFGGILLIWLCLCFLLGFARTASRAKSAT